MRTIATWGTYADLFVVTLLLQTDKWIYSKDAGNKWMLVSGRGANLIDALGSQPVDLAGSNNLYHNGVYYATIIGGLKKKS